jgi:hypothetical protein
MTTSVSYPIPVLGNGDDVDGVLPVFDLEMHTSGTTGELRLAPVPLVTGNPGLDQLVSEERAGWFLRLHCARSYYRREARLSPSSPLLRFSTDEVEGSIVADLFVVALTALPGYRPSGLHDDYGESSFEVAEGEVLAIMGRFEFSVEPRFDPMRADPRSFIQFEKAVGEPEGPFRIDTGGDVIVVYVPEREWELVNETMVEAPELLHIVLAYPALIAGISQLLQDAPDTRRWASRLAAMLRARQLSREDPYGAAQSLLANPLARGLGQALHVMRPEQQG